MIRDNEIDCESYHCKFWGGKGEQKCKIGMIPYRHKEACQRFNSFNPSKFDPLQLDLRR
jgi:hypothetical protein